MIIVIIFMILFLGVIYALYKSNYEHFDNFEIWNNYLSQNDNLDNLQSINKSVDYDMYKIPIYNVKDYNASVWQYRFKNIVGNRYDYNDRTNKKINDKSIHEYAFLKELPTCQDNKNCPVDQLP